MRNFVLISVAIFCISIRNVNSFGGSPEGLFTSSNLRINTQVFLLDSYIPAAMQIIAHLTESMKYDLKPSSKPTPAPGGQNLKPTSTHKPAIYAPDMPLGPEKYEKLVVEQRSLDFFENLENFIGDVPASLIKLLSSYSENAEVGDEDERVGSFLRNFDDSNFREYLEKTKKSPPTRAYVTLLSLYDLLSKDAKSQGYNKFQGYTDHILEDLEESSSKTSIEQLDFVLNKIVKNMDTKQPNTRKKIEGILDDMKNKNSYLHKALKDIPPLKFSA